MATYFPPQQLHGETDSVYDTIRGLGGVLYMPPGNANGVNQFVYPDDSLLAGTVGGAPTFDQSGLVPEILGGSPAATFDDVGDDIRFAIPESDPLQMSSGGSWLYCFTPGAVPSIGSLVHKSTIEGADCTNGYWLFFRSTGIVVFRTSDNSATNTETVTPTGLVVAGERVFVAATCALDGTTKIYINGVLAVTDTGKQIPKNTPNNMTVGGYLLSALPILGPMDFGGHVPDTVLTQPQIAAIAAQCGPLG